MSRWFALVPLLLLVVISVARAENLEPLFERVRAGDLAGVRAMVDDNPALVRARDEVRVTALHVAAREGKRDIAAYLLDKGAEVDAMTTYGGTPLTAAASNGRPQTCALLLDRGADITGRGESVTSQPLFYAILHGHPATVTVLLDRGAKLDVRDDEQETPLHWAVRSGNADTVKLLLARGQAVDAKDQNGDTPVVYAVSPHIADAPVEVLAALLAAGANPNARRGSTADGDSLLRMARTAENVAAVRLLIARGARETTTYLAGPGMPDPRTVRGRVFVPARWLAEWLGGTVTVQGKAVVLALGDSRGRFVPTAPDVVPDPDTYESSLINGTTYVALNDLTRALGVPAAWSAVALEMTLTQPQSGERLRLAVGDPGLTGTQARAVARAGTHTVWVVGDNGYLIGALVNGVPTDADEVKLTPRTLAMKLYSRTRYLGTVTAQIEAPDGAPPLLTVQTPLAGGAGQTLIAIDGTWAAMPRQPRVVPTDDPQARRFAREVLDTYGMQKSTVTVTDALQADLDGDGTEELLVAASRHDAGTESLVKRGDYQFAAVRRAGKPVLLEGAFFKRAGLDLTADYRFAAALDLDADGALEVLVTGAGGGGLATTAHALSAAAAPTPLMTGTGLNYYGGEHGD